MQIASTSNASPLPFTPATPQSGPAQGEDSPFAKMLSAQKQPGPRPPEVHQQQAQDKAQDKSVTKPGAKADAAEDAAPESPGDAHASDPESSPATARRGNARNAPKLALRGRESSIGKLDAKAQATSAEATKPGSDKTADKKDSAQEAYGAEQAAAMNPVPPAAVAAAPTAAAGTAATGASTPAPDAATPDDIAAQAMSASIPVSEGPQVPAMPLPVAQAPRESNAPGTDRSSATEPKRESPFALALAAESADGKHVEPARDKLALAKDSSKGAEPRFELPALRETGAASHLLAAAASPTIDTTATTVPVSMDTPVTSPEFNQALGVQVSVLARDGVQHAELHLNPAEMGPISVQIALDGTRAQVDFGADTLATRQIIESGLPELAAALRDAGFTLSGGGVSQHSQRQAERDGSRASQGASSRRIGGMTEATAPARRATVKMSQGGVDLYA